MTIGFAIGFVAGAGFVFAFLWPIHIRLCRRLSHHHEMEMKAEVLEKTRYASEFDNPDLPRPGAGPEGAVRELFSTRLGALARAKMDRES